jgi:hypothetical protein
MDDSFSGLTGQTDMRLLRIMLVLQVALGLLWGVSMLFFARQIVHGPSSMDEHIEKIAMEGAAHFALVFGAILVWRSPQRTRDVLLLLIFLNALWTLTDLIYIPLLGLDAWDFYAKTIVNAGLAFGLAVGGWRAGILQGALQDHQ